MSSTQTIVWTTVPRSVRRVGRTSVNLAFSVMISPRLVSGDPAATLAEFPDFVDWPTTITNQLSFQLEVRTKAGVTPRRFPVNTTTTPDLWTRLFSATTKVEDHQPKAWATRKVTSYSVPGVMAGIRDSYGKVNTPGRLVSPPGVDVLLQDFTRLLDPAEIPTTMRKDYDKLSAVKAFRTVRRTFEGFRTFFAPTIAIQSPSPMAEPAPPVPPSAPPKPDFHDAVAALGKYPDLLPRFGLVLDFDVTVPLTGARSIPANSVMRVVPVWEKILLPPGSRPTRADQCPWTAYEYGFGRSGRSPLFRAQVAGTGLLLGSRLDIRGGGFTVFQVDPDSSANKLVSAARSMVAAASRLQVPLIRAKASSVSTAVASGKTSTDEAPTAKLPSLTTSGISVGQNDRATKVKASFARTDTLNSAIKSGLIKPGVKAPPAVRADKRLQQADVLWAEDLVRGWRVDVWDDHTRHWHPLCARDAQYWFGAPTTDEPTPVMWGTSVKHREEGFVQAALWSKVGASDNLQVHERMFAWDGWSLVVQRPGNSLLRNGTYGTFDGDVPIGRTKAEGFDLDTVFEVPANDPAYSLPRLRFGWTYKLRARSVDLAGGGEAFAADDDGRKDTSVSEAVTYRRFEPVPPPSVIPFIASAAPGAPETLHKSESPRRLVIHANRDTDLTGSAPDALAVGRFLMPPQGTMGLAETHGKLDAGLGGQYALDVDAYSQILLTHQDSPPNGLPDAVPPDALAYLPDPLATRITMVGVPGASSAMSLGPGAQVISVPVKIDAFTTITVYALQIDLDAAGGRWCDRRPIRIRLVPCETVVASLPNALSKVPAPVWDAATRVLKVFMPRGESASIRVSSAISSTDLALMGQHAWALAAKGADQAKLREIALAGLNPLLTPSDQVELVHAVRQPLVVPTWRPAGMFGTPRALKSTIGQTWGDLRAVVPVHGPSTSKVEVFGRWGEWVDMPTGTAPPNWQEHDSLAMTVPVEYGDKAALDGLDPPGALGGSVDQERATHLRHHFGDTKHREVHYRARVVTRYEDAFDYTGPAAGRTDWFSRTSVESPPVSVPSSARPPVPKVAYIVPTFGWSEDPGRLANRYGGGLRVYLERPWFASGDGELLGAVVWSPTVTAMAADLLGLGRSQVAISVPSPAAYLEPYISRWGQDPLYLSGGLSTYLTAANFTDPAVVASKVKLAEMPGFPVTIVGHQLATLSEDGTRTPRFDPDRGDNGLWFCDLRIQPGSSYTPFVRLALVRYQPSSMTDGDGLAVSPVVIADYAQLLPDRSASVTYGADTGAVDLSVIGATYAKSAYAHSPASQGQFGLADEVAFIVDIEQKMANPTSADFAWVPAEGFQTQGLTRVSGPTAGSPGTMAQWRNGTLKVPKVRAEGQYRLVIKELERWPSSGYAGTAARLAYASTIVLKGS